MAVTMATSTSAAAAPFVRCLLPRPPSSSSQRTKDGASCASNKRSRLVLLQHTANLTTRLTASSPADASAADGSGSRKGGRRGGTSRKASSDTIHNNSSNATSEDALYRLAGLRTPSESALRDLAGGLLALSALEEVASRTEGRVVWVSLANHLSVPSRGDGDGDSGWEAQLQRNGVTVDLASDPLGWDENDDEEDGENNKQDDDDGPPAPHRCYPSRMDSLQAVLTTIERAAASIASTQDGDGNEATTRDIPVIFDSIVPLVSYHGSAKTYRFLHRLLGRGMVGNSSGDSASTRVALSPIVAPISVESIQPADMRRFEDEADAIVCLSGGEMRTMRRGGGDGKVGGAAGRLGSDVQQFALEQNQLQKQQQQQQQPGMTGLGYTSAERLVLLKSSGHGDKEERKKVVVQRKTKDRIDNSGRDESLLLQTTAEKLASVELASPTSQAPSASSSPSQRSRPTLQIGEEGRDTANSAAATEATTDDNYQSQPTSKSGPRIFVQDDDPEFDDMDEEDLDDDLDL